MSSRNYRSMDMTLISRKIIKYYSEDLEAFRKQSGVCNMYC